MSKWIKRAVIATVGLFVAYIATAAVLVSSPEPKFSNTTQAAATEPAVDPAPCKQNTATRCIAARDGTVLYARWMDAGANTTIVLLHGILSESAELEETARLLKQSTGANVLSPDFRGHGHSAGKPGDTAYIGQYEDDVADVVAELRRTAPNMRIVLAGHSMGGGVVMRYAARRNLPKVDGYLLFAPHLGTQAPTTRTEPASGSDAGEAFMQIHLRRTLGLVMFNTIGIHALDYLDTLYFNTPAEARIHRYTFRAMVGTSSDNYVESMIADTLPLLIVVGRDDEAFYAERYPEVVRLHTGGEAVILDHESHDSILKSAAAFKSVTTWFVANFAAH